LDASTNELREQPVKPYTATDAESEMRAALDSGDPERIATATAAVDALEDDRPTPHLLGAALWYAEQGLKVFPLSPGTKIPFKGSNGCHGASANRDVIEGWWDDHADANIGIATGHLIDVVDIDGAPGQKSRAERWEDIFARIDADCVAKVLTPRAGGMHLYVPATGDGNSAGIFPGVDYRGIGGYVVAPPSVTPEGSYRFLGTPELTGLAAKVA
jgi:hypothetical protein